MCEIPHLSLVVSHLWLMGNLIFPHSWFAFHCEKSHQQFIYHKKLSEKFISKQFWTCPNYFWRFHLSLLNFCFTILNHVQNVWSCTRQFGRAQNIFGSIGMWLGPISISFILSMPSTDSSRGASFSSWNFRSVQCTVWDFLLSVWRYVSTMAEISKFCPKISPPFYTI